MLLKDKDRIRSAETEAVGHHGIQSGVVDATCHDGRPVEVRVKILDVGRGADEIVVEHQQRIDGLMDAGRAQRVA